MRPAQSLVEFSTGHPKLVTAAMVGLAVALGLLGALRGVEVDTDPENMLAEDTPVRQFHDRMKEQFELRDMVVVGVVNTAHDDGIFNPLSLARVYELTHYAKTFSWPDPQHPGRDAGVYAYDLLAPSTVDDIQPVPAQNRVDMNWLMPEPPLGREAALDIRRRVLGEEGDPDAIGNPLLKGTLVAEDGQAVAIYLPLTAKDLSYRVYDALNERMPTLWAWGAASLAARKLDLEEAHEEARRAFLRLGRLAAFHSADREAFADVLAALARHAAEPQAAHWTAVRDALDGWADAAEGLDEQAAEAIRPHLEARGQALEAAIEAAEQADQERADALEGLRDDAPDQQWSAQSRRTAQTALDEAPEDGEALRAPLRRALEADHEAWAARIEAAQRANDALRRALEEAAGEADDGLGLRLAAFRAQALAHSVLWAEELRGQVADFADQTAAALEGAGEALTDLPGAVDEALAASESFPGPDEVYITGLPVAEDTFGVQMFRQMAISAPLAMVVIFILMFVFFRKLVLIVSPMVVAVVSVVCTMGLLVGTGHTVHIMSSMIPIFIMPIAVLDSIHMLSEFFDRYQETRDRRETSRRVMGELFVPMLYTSLTSAAGFASLALTPIPPVQVFGVFVALGVMLAWVFTVAFIPAYTMLIPEKRLEGFGAGGGEESPRTPLSRALRWLGGLAYRRAKLILTLTLVAAALAAYGISRIRINDNPVKWFTPGHPIRVADRVLNDHFGGTYMAYLVLEPTERELDAESVTGRVDRLLAKAADDVQEHFPGEVKYLDEARQMARDAAEEAESPQALLDRLERQAVARREGASELPEDETDDAWDAWDRAAKAVGVVRQTAHQTFKWPDALRYVLSLQDYLATERGHLVGKTNSVADIVRKVNKELHEGKAEHYVVPDSPVQVAECFDQFQSGHPETAEDLWHMVEKPGAAGEGQAEAVGYRKASIWVQLRSGDNRDMEQVTRDVDAFLATHAPPVPMGHRWFGLTYINVVWQERMVWGMLQAFLGSFLIVFVMMTVLFRSPAWGLLSMIPLTVTIALIYGLIGLVGKDYDMPVAVLSSLTLGLAVDFAIHFLARSRTAMEARGSWAEAAGPMFGEPARAITRNIIVIAVGFLPLLAAPLMPYKTVGFFMAAILAISGVATLFVLTALVRMLEGVLFRHVKEPVSVSCNCAVCLVSSVAMVVLVALTIHQYAVVGWSTLTWVGAAAIPVLALICGRMSRRQACGRAEEAEESSKS
ncbi:MAG: MMPL family transporter [Candidatus Brocadiia bacterium]